MSGVLCPRTPYTATPLTSPPLSTSLPPRKKFMWALMSLTLKTWFHLKWSLFAPYLVSWPLFSKRGLVCLEAPTVSPLIIIRCFLCLSSDILNIPLSLQSAQLSTSLLSNRTKSKASNFDILWPIIPLLSYPLSASLSTTNHKTAYKQPQNEGMKRREILKENRKRMQIYWNGRESAKIEKLLVVNSFYDLR